LTSLTLDRNGHSQAQPRGAKTGAAVPPFSGEGTDIKNRQEKRALLLCPREGGPYTHSELERREKLRVTQLRNHATAESAKKEKRTMEDFYARGEKSNQFTKHLIAKNL